MLTDYQGLLSQAGILMHRVPYYMNIRIRKVELYILGQQHQPANELPIHFIRSTI